MDNKTRKNIHQVAALPDVKWGHRLNDNTVQNSILLIFWCWFYSVSKCGKINHAICDFDKTRLGSVKDKVPFLHEKYHVAVLCIAFQSSGSTYDLVPSMGLRLGSVSFGNQDLSPSMYPRIRTDLQLASSSANSTHVKLIFGVPVWVKVGNSRGV